MTSSIYPLDDFVFNTILSNVAITSGGLDYELGDEVVFTDSQTGVNATGTVDGVDGSGIITSVNITNFGTGYASKPTGTVTSDNGTGASITFSNFDLITNDFFVDDVSITDSMVSPGGGGIVRFYFAINFADTVSTVTVYNNGFEKGRLNADNSAEVNNDGYYRFDIDVESGDGLNFQSTSVVDGFHLIRLHLVQFGA